MKALWFKANLFASREDNTNPLQNDPIQLASTSADSSASQPISCSITSLNSCGNDWNTRLRQPVVLAIIIIVALLVFTLVPLIVWCIVKKTAHCVIKAPLKATSKLGTISSFQPRRETRTHNMYREQTAHGRQQIRNRENHHQERVNDRLGGHACAGLNDERRERRSSSLKGHDRSTSYIANNIFRSQSKDMVYGMERSTAVACQQSCENNYAQYPYMHQPSNFFQLERGQGTDRGTDDTQPRRTHEFNTNKPHQPTVYYNTLTSRENPNALRLHHQEPNQIILDRPLRATVTGPPLSFQNSQACFTQNHFCGYNEHIYAQSDHAQRVYRQEAVGYAPRPPPKVSIMIPHQSRRPRSASYKQIINVSSIKPEPPSQIRNNLQPPDHTIDSTSDLTISLTTQENTAMDDVESPYFDPLSEYPEESSDESLHLRRLSQNRAAAQQTQIKSELLSQSTQKQQDADLLPYNPHTTTKQSSESPSFVPTYPAPNTPPPPPPQVFIDSMPRSTVNPGNISESGDSPPHAANQSTPQPSHLQILLTQPPVGRITSPAATLHRSQSESSTVIRTPRPNTTKNLGPNLPPLQLLDAQPSPVIRRVHTNPVKSRNPRSTSQPRVFARRADSVGFIRPEDHSQSSTLRLGSTNANAKGRLTGIEQNIQRIVPQSEFVGGKGRVVGVERPLRQGWELDFAGRINRDLQRVRTQNVEISPRKDSRGTNRQPNAVLGKMR